jgi:hypothetical protein
VTTARFERLLEAQRAFVADASHQLRTPLAALRLRLENLESEVLPLAREDLHGAIAEVWRLSRLVDGLLTLARAERGAPARRSLDLSAIATERHAAWAALTDEHGVRVEVQVPSPLPVLATPGHLEQVPDNLLANALEASPAGGRSWSPPAPAVPAGSSSCTSSTRAPACPPSSARGRSTASGARPPPARGVPGWGWRSCASSSPPTAARSSYVRGRVAGSTRSCACTGQAACARRAPPGHRRAGPVQLR